MFFLFLPLQMLVMLTAFTYQQVTGQKTENLFQFKVLPPGPYKLIFWNKFVNRFYGDLDSSKFFTKDAKGHLKFKFDALCRTNKEKAISERFFENRLQSARTENGEFIIKESDKVRQTHVSIVPLSVEERPLAAASAEENSDIAEQIDQLISFDHHLSNPTIIHYHNLERRNGIVLEMIDRWLFGQTNFIGQSDCFFIDAYFRQMSDHLNELIIHATNDQPPKKAKDFELYSELGVRLSRAFHSGQLADRVLMVEGVITNIQMLCVLITTFRRVVQEQNCFQKFGHFYEICPYLFNLRDVAVSIAIDRWLTGEKIADEPLQMGDHNALADLVEHLYQQMQMIVRNGTDNEQKENGTEQTELSKCQSLLMSDQLANMHQMQMFVMLGQKLEKIRKTNVKWAERVTAVIAMLDQLNALCEIKTAIGTKCEASAEWAHATEAWDLFCPHLDEAQNDWVLKSVRRWLKGKTELMPDEHSLLEMNFECLVEKMEPDGQLSEQDIALLHKIGLELTKAKEEKRLAAKVMTSPGIWDQLTNICTLIEEQQNTALTKCWENALCGQLEDIYLSAVMNAFERWRAGKTNDSDTGIILGGSTKALRTIKRVVVDKQQQKQKASLSRTDIVLMAELGAYFAEVIEAQKKAVPKGEGNRKLEQIVGIDKVLKKICKSWPEFRRKIPPENGTMFVSWSKICKCMNLKENEKNEKILDQLEEKLTKKEGEEKENRGTKRTKEQMND